MLIVLVIASRVVTIIGDENNNIFPNQGCDLNKSITVGLFISCKKISIEEEPIPGGLELGLGLGLGLESGLGLELGLGLESGLGEGEELDIFFFSLF